MGIDTEASQASRTTSGTPALSRPNSRVSESEKVKSGSLDGALEVSRTRRARAWGRPAGEIALPRQMTCQVDVGDVVEARAAQIAVAHVEAGRSNQVDRRTKARGKAQDRAGVLRNVGLV
jgi:hypothetical protein